MRKLGVRPVDPRFVTRTWTLNRLVAWGTRTGIALTVVSTACTAVAQQDLIRGLCRQDGCDEFSVVEKTEIGANSLGTLYRTRVKVFHASYGGRSQSGEENGYVLCSTKRPAV